MHLGVARSSTSLCPTGMRPQTAASPPGALLAAGRGGCRRGAYLGGGERLQLAQAPQHSPHVVLQGPDGGGHPGLQLRRRPPAEPGVLLPLGEPEICGAQSQALSAARRCPPGSGRPSRSLSTPGAGTATNGQRMIPWGICMATRATTSPQRGGGGSG